MAVRMPTRFSLALITKVLVSKVAPQVKVELAVPERAENAPLTRRVLSKVELALTKIPAVVEVGVKALVNRVSQAPDDPATVHAAPVTESRPALEACTQDAAAEERLSKVIAPVAVSVPFNLEAPTTPKVVVGKDVPIPTLDSLVFTTSVFPGTPPEKAAMVVEPVINVPPTTVSFSPNVPPGVVVATPTEPPEVIRIRSPLLAVKLKKSPLWV